MLLAKGQNMTLPGCPAALAEYPGWLHRARQAGLLPPA
jgi:hypothetical protein